MITMKQINASVAEEREAFFQLLDERTGETNQRVTETVQEILKTVKAGGDDAVKNYTLKFDGSLPEYYEVPREVINDALTDADQAFVDAMLNAIENVRDFHQRQVEQGFIHPMANGVILGQRVRGLERVGLYVPGGTAAYPSSVIMNAVPAKIAGVKEIIMVTPPRKDGTPNPDILLQLLCAVLTGFSCLVVHRQLLLWHTEQRKFQRLIKSLGLEISMLQPQRSCCMEL